MTKKTKKRNTSNTRGTKIQGYKDTRIHEYKVAETKRVPEKKRVVSRDPE